MQTNTRDLGFVNYNGQEMNFVNYNGVVVYEAWKRLIESGIPPLTLLKCKQANLVDYKVYGESVQEGENLFNKTSIITDLYPNTTIFSTGTVWRGFVFECVPNTTYTLNKIAGQTCYLGTSTEYPANDVSINVRSNNPTGTNTSITTGENDKYVAAFFYRTNADTVAYETILNSVEIKQVTPTPEAPIEIQSVGERTVNLFDIESYGTLKDSNSQPYVLDISQYKVGTKITMTTKDVYYYKISETAGGAGTYQYKTNNHTFTLTEGMINLGHLYIISPTTWSPETQENLRNQNVQIELGSTTTEYEPYGYKIPIKVRGENLFDKDNSKYTRGYISTENGGSIVNSDITDTFYIECKPNTTYIITRTNINVSNQVWRASSTSNIPIAGMILDNMVGGLNNDLTLVITTSNDAKYLLFTEGRTLHTDDLSKFEIRELTTTNIYLNEPLRKIGNYADYIDFESGNVVRNIAYKEITSSSITAKSSSSTDDYNYYFITFPKAKVGGGVPILSNIGGGTHNAFAQKNKEGIFTNTNTTFFLSFFDIKTLADAKQFVTDNYVYANYILNTPTEEEITLPNIPTIKGTTIIEVDTTIKPSNMEVVYLGKK